MKNFYSWLENRYNTTEPPSIIWSGKTPMVELDKLIQWLRKNDKINGWNLANAIEEVHEKTLSSSEYLQWVQNQQE
jgi:hypothetical protein